MVSSLRSFFPVSLVGKILLQIQSENDHRSTLLELKEVFGVRPRLRGSRETTRGVPLTFCRTHEVGDWVGCPQGSPQSCPRVPTPPFCGVSPRRLPVITYYTFNNGTNIFTLRRSAYSCSLLIMKNPLQVLN